METTRRTYNVMMDIWKTKPLRSRKRLNDYVLLQTLGRGAFGKVKLAISLRKQQFVAVKIINIAVRRRVSPAVALFQHMLR